MVCYSFDLLFDSTSTLKLYIINQDIIICYTEDLPIWIILIDFTMFMIILYALGYNNLILISIEGMWFQCYTLEFILHLHHTCIAFEVMSWTYGCDRTGTASYIVIIRCSFTPCWVWRQEYILLHCMCTYCRMLWKLLIEDVFEKCFLL